MDSPSLDPLWEYKQRQQDLLAEAEHERLVREALRARQLTTPTASIILAQMGKKMVELGTRLEERYGVAYEPQARLNHDCCSSVLIERDPL